MFFLDSRRLIHRFGRSLTLATAALLVMALSTAATWAEDNTRVVADDGALYTVRAGSLGELFGDAAPGTRHLQALALDIESRDADGQPTLERHLVPGTDTWRIEHGARVAYHDASGSALLLWTTDAAQDTTRVRFATFRDGDWSAVSSLEAAGYSLRLSSAPEILQTQDTTRLELEGLGDLVVERQIFHILWREASSGRVRYAPITFVDGTYIGWHEIVTLSTMAAASHEDEEPSPVPAALAEQLRVDTDGKRTLSVVFAEPAYGRLVSMQLAVRPLQLSLLGEDLEQFLLDRAADFDPEQIDSFAGEIYGRIVVLGSRFDMAPAITEYLAEHLAQWLAEVGVDYEFGDLDLLGNMLRLQTLAVGDTVYASTRTDADGGLEMTIDVGDLLHSNGHREDLAEMIAVDIRADVVAPMIGGLEDGEGPSVTVTNLLTSRDGRELIIAWTTHDGIGTAPTSVSYVELDDGSWSEARTLSLSGSLDQATAHTLLSDRLR